MQPNPFLVKKQPQAKVRGQIVRAHGVQPVPSGNRSMDGFKFAVERLESADLVTEGAIYDSETPAKFYGSAVLIMRRISDAGLSSPTGPIGVLEDPRLTRIIEGRLFREIIRHLGQAAPVDFEWNAREVLEGGEQRVIMDFECVVDTSQVTASMAGR